MFAPKHDNHMPFKSQETRIPKVLLGIFTWKALLNFQGDRVTDHNLTLYVPMYYMCLCIICAYVLYVPMYYMCLCIILPVPN